MALSEKFAIIIPPQDIPINPDYLRRLSVGDPGAFEWVYKNYCGKIYDYALLMTRDVQLSEDIVQEVFLKIWMHRTRLTSIENFNGYVHIIVRNYTLSHLRDQVKERCHLREYGKFKSASASVVQENMEDKEKERILNEGVKLLPPRQQLVYLLRRELGWKREQIAEELKVSTLTVKAHIQKAIKSIRSYISKRME